MLHTFGVQVVRLNNMLGSRLLMRTCSYSEHHFPNWPMLPDPGFIGIPLSENDFYCPSFPSQVCRFAKFVCFFFMQGYWSTGPPGAKAVCGYIRVI